MAEKRTIDWASAEVKGGVMLLVPLTGASSKDWSERFEGVLRLLEQSNSAWGGVSSSKKTIKVNSVHPGAERDLHHFLESVVVQVNADLPGEDSDGQSVQPRDDRDRQMAESFRALAGGED
jgi:hypothetical protein